MSVFNEEDIIEETVKKLVENGVDIYVLDNGCTDRTIEIINKYVGKGVVDILYFITEEDGKKVFSLRDILEQFELAARKMPYDWYLISDADEIKYGPWQSENVREAVDRVDFMGFNLINFKLYDFRPTIDEDVNESFEDGLVYYSLPEPSSAIQMKCWKRSNDFDIKSFGGHIISVPEPKLFPVKFINKHYPIRSGKHGYKKLKNERMSRYSRSELDRGWHTHYSNLNIESQESLVWDKNDLILFDIQKERLTLFEEAWSITSNFTLMMSFKNDDNLLFNFIEYAAKRLSVEIEHAIKIFNVAENIWNVC